MNRLLPEVTGLRVLDAGCGPGGKAEALLDAGAGSLTAIDVTPEFVEMTAQRLGDRADVRCHDLADPLDFAADAAFDLIYSNFVLHYVRDWRPLMREFYRVLAPGGRLLFSDGSPFGDWLLVTSGTERVTMSEEPSYFQIQPFSVRWRGFGDPAPVIWVYRRSLEETLAPVLEAGFHLERLVEPQPTEEFLKSLPELGATYSRRPSALCVRARKP